MPHNLSDKTGEQSRNAHIVEKTHLFTKEIADLYLVSILLDDAVYGEVGIYSTHFIKETLRTASENEIYSKLGNAIHLGDTNDHIVYETLNGPQTRDVLSSTLPHGQEDFILPLGKLDVHVNMLNILRERAPRTGDSYDARFDSYGDPLWDIKFFGAEDVPHLQGQTCEQSASSKVAYTNPSD
jgi:hypothetical protein